MQHCPDTARNQPQGHRKALCRIELLQSALSGLVPLDHRLETLLDRIEVGS